MQALFQPAQHLSDKKKGSGSGSIPLTNGSGSGRPNTDPDPTPVFLKLNLSRDSALYKELTLFRAGVREDNQDLAIQGHMVPAVQGQFIIQL